MTKHTGARLIVQWLLILSIGAAPFAQSLDDDDVDGMRALDIKIERLAKQIAELNTMLRSMLPPSPVTELEVSSLSINDAPTRGSANARVVVIEYADFECPFCGRYARSVYPQVQKEFVDAGKIRYVFRHLPLEQMHHSARKAAEAGECANEQGRFWEFHDRLFANQKPFTAAELNDYARAEQLDMRKFESCLTAGISAAKVTRDLAEAERIGLTGTPAFLLGEVQTDGSVRVTRLITGAQPFQVFQTALDRALAATGAR